MNRKLLSLYAVVVLGGVSAVGQGLHASIASLPGDERPAALTALKIDAGTITLVYDHHRPHLQSTLTDIQHDHHDVILSTVHVHLDHHNCLEVLLVRGKGHVIRKIADALITAAHKIARSE